MILRRYYNPYHFIRYKLVQTKITTRGTLKNCGNGNANKKTVEIENHATNNVKTR